MYFQMYTFLCFCNQMYEVNTFVIFRGHSHILYPFVLFRTIVIGTTQFIFISQSFQISKFRSWFSSPIQNQMQLKCLFLKKGDNKASSTVQKTDKEVQQSSDFSQNYFARVFLKTWNTKFCPCIFCCCFPALQELKTHVSHVL